MELIARTLPYIYSTRQILFKIYITKYSHDLLHLFLNIVSPFHSWISDIYVILSKKQAY